MVELLGDARERRAQLIRVEIGREESGRHDAELRPRADELRAEVESSWDAYKRWRKKFSLQWERGLPARPKIAGVGGRCRTASVMARG